MKRPHVIAELRMVGHGYQLDIYDFTLATADGQGVVHQTECCDFSDSQPSICQRAEQARFAIVQACHAMTGTTVLTPHIAVNSHDDLLAALTRLLDCPDLNLDELEPETPAAIDQANEALTKAKGE